MGKSAFQGSRKNIHMLPPEEIDIVTDKKDPLFDERALDEPAEAMILSVMAKGVLEPILVCKRGEVATVIDGRQRVMAAREANKRLTKQGDAYLIAVPCFLRRGDDAAELTAIMIHANEQRKPDAAKIKARKAKRLVDRGATHEEAGIAFGVTDQTIKRWLGLLEPGVGDGEGEGESKEKKTRAKKTRSRKEIQKRIADNPNLPPDYLLGLRWVLREEA